MISLRAYRSISFLFLLHLLALLGIACQSPKEQMPKEPSSEQSSTPAADNCRTVEHEKGETEICGQPQRVATLSPHILDNLLALGVQPAAHADSNVPSTPEFDQPEAQIPYLGRYITTQPVNLGLRDSPSIERLVQLEPDLIVGESWLSEKQYQLLSQVAPTMLFNDRPGAIQHWRYSIEGVAKAVDKETEAKALLGQYSEKIAATREQLAPVVAAYPNVMVIDSDTALSAISLSDDHTATNLLREVGFEIVSSESSSLVSGSNPQVSIEIIPQIETDLVFVMAWGDDNMLDPQKDTQQKWNDNPLLNQMSVAKEGRVFFVNYYLWGSHTRGPITERLILEQLPQMLLPLVDEAQ